ncbi:MAG: flagellar biosynthesis protein FlhB [Proteobacteria bacterium]|nr:flagellar biosynthesis protein FlhB [Pseudomonadota bacterium]
MAESEDSERTEEPSQRRLQQARERGQIPRSRELTNFATMIGGSLALLAMGSSLPASLMGIMRRSLALDAALLADSSSMSRMLGSQALQAVLALLPLFAALIVLVLLAAMALGGWNVSARAIQPDFSRLSPLAGFKRMFGLHGWSELGKALLKFLVVGGVCACVVWWLFADVLRLSAMAPRSAIGHAAALLSRAFVWLCAALVVIAAVDVPLQLYQYKRSLKMSRHELREEAKETDGRPEVRSRIRQMQQQLARRRMMQAVPKADVVVVNPEHFAVALQYEPTRMRAPRVVAKGVDLIALNIRRIAEQHRVPVFESPKLARALYRSTDLNEEIPSGLYLAVAQVLSYLFRIKSLNPTLAARMARPDPTVGDEFDVS